MAPKARDFAMGVGYLDVSVEVLSAVLALLPKTYEVVGSHESITEGVVRLKLRSEILVGYGNQLTCTVTDAGSTRRAMILPA